MAKQWSGLEGGDWWRAFESNSANPLSRSVRNDLQLRLERIRYFTRTTLQRASRTAKQRVISERLSGKPGLNRRSGRLQKSVRFTVTAPGPDRQKLSGKVGGKQAPYAVIHERHGRLGFEKVFQEEYDRTLPIITRGIKQIIGERRVG